MANVMSISESRTDLSDGEQLTASHYTPGHARQKLMMVCLGLFIFGFGLSQMWTPLRLLFLGNRAMAEATRVIKTKEGVRDLVMISDLQIKANQEAHDRSYVFWNEFHFQTAEGREINVRSSIGSQLKPLYPLFDDDGLPTEIMVCYDPNHPEIVAFPAIFSTWFVPGTLALIGLGCVIIGMFLFTWARRPIELPHIVPIH
jgi:hypothetical protein